jgi:DNA-3-methyladenine glycosylase
MVTNARTTVPDFLSGNAVDAAQELLGWRFFRQENDGLVGGVILETEAYTQEDAASHSYKGQTPRSITMFGPAGHLYVYFTYGMHYCANIVTGKPGDGQAVLLRSLHIDQGIDVIRDRRGTEKPDRLLTDGPAKICQALLITTRDDGRKINDSDFLLLPPLQAVSIQPPTTRIGISHNTEALWRFTATI